MNIDIRQGIRKWLNGEKTPTVKTAKQSKVIRNQAFSERLYNESTDESGVFRLPDGFINEKEVGNNHVLDGVVEKGVVRINVKEIIGGGSNPSIQFELRLLDIYNGGISYYSETIYEEGYYYFIISPNSILLDEYPPDSLRGGHLGIKSIPLDLSLVEPDAGRRYGRLYVEVDGDFQENEGFKVEVTNNWVIK